MLVMMPFFLLAMYEKHGQPLEKIVGNILKVAVIRPKQRPYQTNNFYAVLKRQEIDVYKRQDQYAVLVREFCQQQFVSKGMIADFAIHDPHPPGHNPHAHVLLTMRAMDEHGKWLPKSRKVYDFDENGERIKLLSGRWKSHKEEDVYKRQD